ncbi:MAG: hypothetical protein IJY20_03620 [Clostridia bacterium]|nr:hypothetical protein [Clostridia bacterium]
MKKTICLMLLISMLTILAGCAASPTTTNGAKEWINDASFETYIEEMDAWLQETTLLERCSSSEMTEKTQDWYYEGRSVKENIQFMHVCGIPQHTSGNADGMLFLGSSGSYDEERNAQVFREYWSFPKDLTGLRFPQDIRIGDGFADVLQKLEITGSMSLSGENTATFLYTEERRIALQQAEMEDAVTWSLIYERQITELLTHTVTLAFTAQKGGTLAQASLSTICLEMEEITPYK